MRTKYLYCVAGPSGVGKTTLANALDEAGMRRAITCTTRAKRPSESDSAYHFLSEPEFHDLERKGLLMESALYAGNYYGSTLEELDSSDFVILEPEGIRSLRERYRTRPIKVIGLVADSDDLHDRICIRGSADTYRLHVDEEVFNGIRELSDLCVLSISPEYVQHQVLNFISVLENTAT